MIYGTNGFTSTGWDDTTSPPRPVQGFHTRDELELMPAPHHAPLAGLPLVAGIVECHLPAAPSAACWDLSATSAPQGAGGDITSVGKTRTVIALVDLLMRANWTKRVLFWPTAWHW